eukprot:COSAG04_NODE_1509_length_6497_cov_6.319319_3_plen_68_part_00
MLRQAAATSLRYQSDLDYQPNQATTRLTLDCQRGFVGSAELIKENQELLVGKGRDGREGGGGARDEK